MTYFLNTPEDRQAMLRAIGVESMEELLEAIPAALRLDRPLDVPAAMSELELTQHMHGLANSNTPATHTTCFLGAGSYDHFVPAVVDALASRSEFYSSYTPYQPEVAQGNLQVMFEYQTLICQLTGLDVSNASLYDGGTSAVEAVLLCMSATRRYQKVVVADSVHPEYRQILQTYLDNLDAQLVTVPTTAGRVAPEQLASALDDQVACVLLQHPNFFGCLEDAPRLVDLAHQCGALAVSIFDPISLGILQRPADLGFDVAVAEGQGLGNPLQFGGPYLGIMACRNQFVRRLPGRIAGQTVDRRGRRCWVLTLQTREQHIRRDKATSNICTNQGLLALRAAIYLSWLGPHGLRETAALCARKAHYAAEQLAGLERFERRFGHPVFKEFVVRDRGGDVEAVLAHAAHDGCLAGVPLECWYPDLSDCFLVAVTEKRTRAEIDQLRDSLANCPAPAACAPRA